MPTYTIKTPFVTVTRKRRDCAAGVFLREVWKALHAGGQLDTQAGHNCYNACKQMARDVASGAYAQFSFSRPLPHNAGLIEFERNN